MLAGVTVFFRNLVRPAQALGQARVMHRLMTKPTREWFLILDDKLRLVDPKAYSDATAAIWAANDQAPWPEFQGRLVVRSNYDEDGIKIGDGQGRIAATREKGRWRGPDVTAGSGYLVGQTLEAAHERRYNLPRTTKSSAQLRREIKEVLNGHAHSRRPIEKEPTLRRRHATPMPPVRRSSPKEEILVTEFEALAPTAYQHTPEPGHYTRHIGRALEQSGYKVVIEGEKGYTNAPYMKVLAFGEALRIPVSTSHRQSPSKRR